MNKIELLMKAASVRAKQLLETERAKQEAQQIKRAFLELKNTFIETRKEEIQLLKKALDELEQIKKLLPNKSENNNVQS